MTDQDLQDEIARQAALIADRAMVLATREPDQEPDVRAAVPPADTMDAGSWAAALWSWRHGEPAGRGTGTLPSAPWRFLPIRITGPGTAVDGRAEGLLGLLAVQPTIPLDAPALQALQALADQAALALERVRLVREAADATARDETQKLRTALLNSLSHDLRTPLTGIRGSAETLRTAWSRLTPDTRDDLLLAIEEDTMRMTRFLANITDMTRLESGVVVPKLQRIEPARVVREAVARLESPASVTVREDGPHPFVLADPLLLEQVVFNVLDNALKYSPPPQAEQSLVEVVIALENSKAVIRVADRGTGITEAELPHVFDSFYRAQHGDRVVAGTGLGLAIARGLVEVMGGSIIAASPVPQGWPGAGAGTLVTITMPAAR